MYMTKSSSPDWKTETRWLNFIMWVARATRIDLDPASNAENSTNADRFYAHPMRDGLAESWSPTDRGRLLYLNPPGGKLRPLFYDKLATVKNEWAICALMIFNPDHLRHASRLGLASVIFVPDKRMQFIDPTGGGRKSAASSSFIAFSGRQVDTIDTTQAAESGAFFRSTQ